MEYKYRKPESAIILAAGVGKRMIPININIPKGLVIVKGEPLIERLIKQLHEKDITNIYIVIGYLGKKYSYLENKYNVKLINNLKYAESGNIVSLYKVRKYINNTYIIHSNVWSRENPFNEKESYSWYMVEDELDKYSSIKVKNKNNRQIFKNTKGYGNRTLGIAFIGEEDSDKLLYNIKKTIKSKNNTTRYWENSLLNNGEYFVKPKVMKKGYVYDLNSFEDLRDLDSESDSLNTKEINIISKNLKCKESEIVDITVLKKGMTNRSFKFTCRDKRYIMRIPGEGTDMLVNRKDEYEVYNKIEPLNLTDTIVYMNPKIGYKITEYIPFNRICDPRNTDDLKKCMSKLRELHDAKIKVNHEFDLFEKIEYYEKLRGDSKSIYNDYQETKNNMYILERFIDNIPKEYVLTHIDAVPENFLIHDNEVTLIDWEYSSMADPHIDLAMFSLYSEYNKEEVDKLLNIYFRDNIKDLDRIKIYGYIAISGLLWSNWCEYKSLFGVEFGDYGYTQYRYAKDFFRLVESELEKLNMRLSSEKNNVKNSIIR